MPTLLRARDGGRGKALRSWGWRRGHPATEHPAEIFRCADTCRRQGTALLDAEQQAAWCCSLPHFPRRRWDVDADALVRPSDKSSLYFGAPPRFDLEGEDPEWDEPLERMEIDGCPGGWYRTPWVESVLRYARRPVGEGARIPNRLLDLTDDELVIEAAALLEAHEDAWASEHRRHAFERLERQRAMASAG